LSYSAVHEYILEPLELEMTHSRARTAQPTSVASSPGIEVGRRRGVEVGLRGIEVGRRRGVEVGLRGVEVG